MYIKVYYYIRGGKLYLINSVRGLFKYLLLFIMAVAFFATTDNSHSTVNERHYTNSVSEISSCYSGHHTAYSDACVTQQVPSANVVRSQQYSKRVNNNHKRGLEFTIGNTATAEVINYNREISSKKHSYFTKHSHSLISLGKLII